MIPAAMVADMVKAEVGTKRKATGTAEVATERAEVTVTEGVEEVTVAIMDDR